MIHTTHRVVLEANPWNQPEAYLGDAAAPPLWRPHGPRLLRVVALRAPVAIAAFLALYFAWQFAGRPGL